MSTPTFDEPPAHPGTPGSERVITTAEKDAQAARLRTYGFSYRQISKQLGWAHPSTAHKAVRRALAEVVREAGEDLLKLELERFDSMLAPMIRLVETGTPAEQMQAVDRVLKISAERRRLLGMDAPTKQEVRITDSVDAQIEQLAAELAQLDDASLVREDG